MNKIIVAIAFICLSLSSKAENTIQVMPFSANVGMTSDDMKTFNIEMTNEEDIWGVQFDLYLPKGMTLDFTDDYPPYDDIATGAYDRYPYTSGRNGTKTYKHGIEWNKLNDVEGHYRFAITPNDESFITETSGTILTLYYLTSTEMKPGIYPILIKNMVISGKTVNVNPADAISYVKVGTISNKLYELDGDYYVPSFVQSELAKDKNIIVNGECQNLVLTDDLNLDAVVSCKAAKVTYDADISSSLGFKTVVLPFSCDVPTGFEAYEVGDVINNELQMTRATTIKANYPVILKNVGTALLSASNVDVDFSAENLAGGQLVGTYEEIDAPVGSYVLQNQGGTVAFYLVGEDVQPKVGAFRAYLAPQIAGAKILYVNFDDAPTCIRNFDAVQNASVIYNTSGQHVNEVQQGVNIIRFGKEIKKYIK